MSLDRPNRKWITQHQLLAGRHMLYDHLQVGRDGIDIGSSSNPECHSSSVQLGGVTDNSDVPGFTKTTRRRITTRDCLTIHWIDDFMVISTTSVDTGREVVASSL